MVRAAECLSRAYICIYAFKYMFSIHIYSVISYHLPKQSSEDGGVLKGQHDGLPQQPLGRLEAHDGVETIRHIYRYILV